MPTKSKAKRSTKAAASLVEFVRDERRKDCPICKLPESVRAQLQEASQKKINMNTQVRWLNEVHGADVSYDDLKRHKDGRHDYA